MSYISDVVTAIDWVDANRATYNIRIMNLSLLSSVAESYKTSTLDAAVERAWFNGILVVVAAGNGGANTMQYPPANDPFVITVGATDTMGTPGRGDDTHGALVELWHDPGRHRQTRPVGARPLHDRAAGEQRCVTLAKQMPERWSRAAPTSGCRARRWQHRSSRAWQR